MVFDIGVQKTGIQRLGSLHLCYRSFSIVNQAFTETKDLLRIETEPLIKLDHLLIGTAHQNVKFRTTSPNEQIGEMLNDFSAAALTLMVRIHRQIENRSPVAIVPPHGAGDQLSTFQADHEEFGVDL